MKIEFNPEGLKKYFKNTSWLLVERVFRMASVLIINIFIVRYLGPEQYGVLSYVLSFVGLFIAVSSLGLDEIVTRELVRYPEKYIDLLGTALSLKIIGAFLMILLLSISVITVTNSSEINLFIFIIALSAFFQATNVIDCYFQSKVFSRYVVQAKFGQVLLSLIFKMTLIYVEAPLIWFVIAITIDWVLLSVGLLIIYYRYLGNTLKLKFNRKLAFRYLADSWPLIFSGIMVSIYMKIDQVMIKFMIDEKAVGIYATAVNLSEAWYFIPVVITSSLFPAIINSKEVSQEFYHDRLEKLYKLIVWVPIIISIFITSFSDWVIATLYGEPFLDASIVLSIHIWASVFVFLGVASSKWLMVENMQLLSMMRTLIGMIVNIILNIILIPKYGVIGAAIATFISYFVATFSIIIQFRNKKVMSNFVLMIKAFFPYIHISREKIRND